MIDKAMIEDMLYTNPLSLLATKDKQVIEYVNNLVPYSTAFEIECDKSSEYNEGMLKAIPYIMSVGNDDWEQRYRIPNGLRGIICLYFISYQLKINSLLNPLSSIHYHVDCTDCYSDICNLINSNIEYILSELDTWLGNDTATSRHKGSWFKLNELKTVEFRLGEMTFDYKILLKRIIHVNTIVKKFKDELNIAKSEFEEIDIPIVVTYYKYILTIDVKRYSRILSLNKKLEELTSKQIKEKPSIIEETKNMYRDRVHFINQDNNE